MSHKEKQDKEKEKENQGLATAAAKTRPVTPGFGKGRLTQLPDGNWQADITCINGATARSLTVKLPAGLSYYGGGGRVASPADTMLYLPDGATVDTNFIFPWDPTNPDALRLGGGVGTGIVLEGAQRRNAGPKDAIQAPMLTTDWINGATARVSVYIDPGLGVTFFPNDRAFALILVDAVSGAKTVKAVAKAEGDCLAVIV